MLNECRTEGRRGVVMWEWRMDCKLTSESGTVKRGLTIDVPCTYPAEPHTSKITVSPVYLADVLKIVDCAE